MNLQESRLETRLESWKEIGAYLQRDSTTARRWEKEEGLPVHRHTHKSRSSVYAYPSEIDAWRATRKAVPEPLPARPLWKLPAFALTMLLCLIMVGNGVRQVAAQQAGLGISKRLCTTCGGVSLPASITLDGRWMTTGDEDVTIRDLTTGKETRLTNEYRENEQTADWSLLSPDLRQVAYGWFVGNDREGHSQLRVIPNQPGAKSRILLDNPEFGYFHSGAWYPDGKAILLVASRLDNTWQLVRVSVADGSFTVLKSLGWRLRGMDQTVSISPDGNTVAYAALVTNPAKAPAPVESKDSRIYLLSGDGSSETELSKTAGRNTAPAWTPDGGHILFLSDLSGKDELWSVVVQDRRAAGAPTLVAHEMAKAEPLGMTRSGSYYFAQRNDETEYVSIARLGSSTPDTFVGLSPTWSPDGKAVAFKRHVPGSNLFDLVVRSMENGEERIYHVNAGSAPPIWFSTRDVLVGLRQSVDLQTGEVKGLPDSSIPAAERIVYIVRRDPKDAARIPDRIVAVDLTTLKEQTIYTAPAPGGMAVAASPDGTMLAVRRHNNEGRSTHIAEILVDGSGYRELFEYSTRQTGSSSVTWTQDGRWILFGQDQGVALYKIMRISGQGGTPQFTGTELQPGLLQTMSVSPDSSRIAYSSTRFGISVWALDNALSVLK